MGDELPRAAPSVPDAALVVGECPSGHRARVPSYVVGDRGYCSECERIVEWREP